MRNVGGLRKATLAMVLALGVGGCIAGDGSSPPPISSPVPSPSPSPSTGSGTLPITPAPSPMNPSSEPVGAEHIEAARADLAQRFGYDPTTIVVDTVEAVTWRDAALGCPNHERSYDPTPVPGYRVALRVGDLDFQYHGALDEAPFLCQFLD